VQLIKIVKTLHSYYNLQDYYTLIMSALLVEQIMDLVLEAIHSHRLGTDDTGISDIKKALVKVSKSKDFKLTSQTCSLSPTTRRVSDEEEETVPLQPRQEMGQECLPRQQGRPLQVGEDDRVVEPKNNKVTFKVKNGSRFEVYNGDALHTRGKLYKEDLTRVESKNGTVKYVAKKKVKEVVLESEDSD
jgi:hypothetical protein